MGFHSRLYDERSPDQVAVDHGRVYARCLALEADRGITAEKAIDVLAELFHLRGVPQHIRSRSRCADARGCNVRRSGQRFALRLQRILERRTDDCLPLPIFQPPVARHLAVMLVPLAVVLLPVEKLALGDAQPDHELSDWNLRPLVPASQVIDDFIVGVVENPTSV